MKALLDSGAKSLTIVGKTSRFHVTEVLRVSLEENLAMIRDTVAYLRECGREVIYDAEHFFDGWKLDPEYAAKTVRAAAEAGAMPGRAVRHQRRQMPEEIAALTKAAQAAAVACRSASIATTIAIWPWPTRWPPSMPARCKCKAPINGVGERCGNADLISVCANLAVKKSGYEVLAEGGMRAAHRALAIRLRHGQHELPRQPAVRRPKRVRPQRRHARPRHRAGHQQLRAHRAGIGRQRTAHPGQRTFRPFEHRGADEQTKPCSTTRS